MLPQSARLSKIYKHNLLRVIDRLNPILYRPKRLFQSEINKFLSAFPSVYSQKECEQFWSDVWQKSGLFTDQSEDSPSSFRILLPPPNITGNLHLGNL